MKHFEMARRVTFGLLFTQKGAHHGQKTHAGGKDRQPNSWSQFLRFKEWFIIILLVSLRL